jgi:rSAM/selenodomain-associated transferase 1
MSHRRLLVFVKEPVAGRVKTRLAATIGAEAALEVYCQLLAITGAAISRSGISCHVAVDGGEVPWEIMGLLPGPWSVQAGEDLGARMDHAMAQAFSEGAGAVVLIGSDLPDLKAGVLEDAFGRLEDHDMVLGPALDGGFYLVGLRRYVPELFLSLPWSTDRVFALTRARAHELGLSCDLLPVLQDLDDAQDLRRFERALSGAKENIGGRCNPGPVVPRTTP